MTIELKEVVTMGDPITLDILGDELLCSERLSVALITGLISNYSTTEKDGLAVSLGNLWSLKENPVLSASNMMIGNSEELVEDLRKTKNRTVVVDITAQVHGRDCLSLRSIASHVLQRVTLFCSTSPNTNLKTPESIVAAMKSDLLASVSYGEKTFSASTVSKSVAVTYRTVGPHCTVAQLTEESMLALVACGNLHRALSLTTLPPIVIALAPLSVNQVDVLTVLHSNGADLSRVVFNHTALNHSLVDHWDALLTTYPCSVCVDCFGYASTFSPPEGPSFPSDDEMLAAVIELCRRGHVSRIILSLSIYCKIQLPAYGGYGYQYMERVIRPRLVNKGVDESTVQKLCCDNLMNLLRWRQREIERPKEVETLGCHICQKRFPAASDYFSKFEFVYCSSKCLAAHRNNNFKLGP